jgi:multidrug efflux system membrane fusion protein
VAAAVYYSGLGAVTPLATVTVRTRVDGQLMNVRHREGDTVQQGAPLAEIDDGPYQAALTQAQGQLMKDQAALENARIDLVRYQQLVARKAGPEQQLATQQRGGRLRERGGTG